MWGAMYGFFRKIHFLEAENQTRRYITFYVKCCYLLTDHNKTYTYFSGNV